MIYTPTIDLAIAELLKRNKELEVENAALKAVEEKFISTSMSSAPPCPQCKSVDTGYRCCSCGTEWGADDD